MQNAKGAPHLLNPFADFFCVPKRNSAKEKGTAARGLSGEFLAPAFRRMLRSPKWCRAERDVLVLLISFVFI